MYNGGVVTAVFDGSFDGFLSVIFARYYQKLRPQRIVSAEGFQQGLGEEYTEVETDGEQAKRVFAGLEKVSVQVAVNVYRSFAAPNPDRYMDIFSYAELAFKVGADVDRFQKLDYVLNVLGMSAAAGKEAHNLTGFIRFAQTKSGVLYSEIGPKHDVLELVCGHFTQRLNSERFVIHDTKRRKAAIYDSEELVIAATNGQVSRLGAELAPDEESFQRMWVEFLNSVAIESRKNPKLQRGLLPYRYRPYMVEFGMR